MNWQILAIVAYLLLSLAISFWVSLRVKTTKDYFVGGRSVGVLLATVSIFATWFGAETCMGSSGAIYMEGLSGSKADPLGYAFCLLFAGVFFAYKLWQNDVVTLPDFFKKRFGPRVEFLASLIVIPTSLVWASAQIRAFGQVVTMMTPMSFHVAMAIAAIAVIAYTFVGGILSDIFTDFIQAIVLIIGLLILLVFSVSHLGGLELAIKGIDASRLSFVQSGESFLSRLDAWTIPILGSVVAQELVSRMVSCRGAKQARFSAVSASLLYLMVGLIPVLLGLFGPKLISGLEDQDQFLPTLAKTLLPPWMFVVFVASILSAILSTVDSTILSVSSIVSQNILPRWPQISGQLGELKSARLIVLVSGVVAYVGAITGQSIYDLVEMASSWGSAGVFVIAFLGLWTKWHLEKAAFWTLIVGCVFLPLASHVLHWQAPYVATLGASMATYLGIHVFEFARRREAYFEKPGIKKVSHF